MSGHVAPRYRIRSKMTLMSQAEGASSGSEEECEAAQTARGMCGQFVWPCPREYPTDAATRKSKKWLIPADLSKEDFGLLFKGVWVRFGQGPNMERIHVLEEPHEKYSKLTGLRERHKHLIFKMRSTFAHTGLNKALASQGVYVRFSFSLVGYGPTCGTT